MLGRGACREVTKKRQLICSHTAGNLSGGYRHNCGEADVPSHSFAIFTTRSKPQGAVQGECSNIGSVLKSDRWAPNTEFSVKPVDSCLLQGIKGIRLNFSHCRSNFAPPRMPKLQRFSGDEAILSALPSPPGGPP
jgi:hypothetical protein